MSQSGKGFVNGQGKKRSRWRTRWLKLILIVGVPLGLLLALEIVLRLVAFGYSTRFFATAGTGQYRIPNRDFARRFFPPETVKQSWPFMMVTPKPAGLQRIFVLGDSAAQGTPAPAFGFARQLETMLQEQYPGRQFEVINAAMRGINSHVVLPIAEECAQYQPDAFILYLGNNEIVGLYSPDPEGFSLTPHLGLLRLRSALKTTKVGQLVERAILAGGGHQPAPKQDLAYFQKQRLAADHPKRQAVYDNFRANLLDICRAAQKSGAQVLVATVPVNLKDSPPFGSLHRADLTADQLAAWEQANAAAAAAAAANNPPLAREHLQKAIQLDDHYAETHYRLAQALLAENQVEAARKHFVLARDWDALAFRMDSRLNEIVRQVVSRQPPDRVHLVDLESAFARDPLSEHQLPGDPLFHEHVHLRFTGDYVAASNLFIQLTASLGLAATNPPTRALCAERLGFTPWDEVDTAAAIVRMTGDPLFQAQWDHARRQAQAEQAITQRVNEFNARGFGDIVALYQRAIDHHPNDWQLRLNLGNLLMGLRQLPAANEHHQAMVRLMPYFAAGRILAGNSLLAVGRPQEALVQYEAALSLDPRNTVAREGIRQATATRLAGTPLAPSLGR